jgi:hypothetical protein
MTPTPLWAYIQALRTFWIASALNIASSTTSFDKDTSIAIDSDVVS